MLQRITYLKTCRYFRCWYFAPACVSNNYDTLYTLRVFSKNDIFCDFYQKNAPKNMKNKNAKVKMVQIHWSSSRYNSLAKHYSAKGTKPQNV